MRFEKFIIHGGAEAKPPLQDNSIDLIVCAQTFHWLDRKKAKSEFKRIAKKDAYLCLIWNDRKSKCFSARL